MKANTNPTDLQAITPVEALRLYLESKVDEWATATKELQQFHLNEFVEWLAEEDIDDMRNISARTVHRFRLKIKGDIAQSTLAQRVNSLGGFSSSVASSSLGACSDSNEPRYGFSAASIPC